MLVTKCLFFLVLSGKVISHSLFLFLFFTLGCQSCKSIFHFEGAMFDASSTYLLCSQCSNAL